MLSYAARCLAILFLMLGLHLTRIVSLDATAHANVSLRMLNGNVPVACVSINGREPVQFVVDTGTNTTLVDPRLAARFPLRSAGTKRLTTLSGSVQTLRYILDSISIGGASLSRVEALEQPMKELQKFDPDILGIIGLDFLSAFSFRIDYQRMRLELYAPDEFPAIAGGIRVPFRIFKDRILIQVFSKHAEQRSWQLALDSGISRILIFKNRLVLPEPPTLPGSNLFPSLSNAFTPRNARQVATNLSPSMVMPITLDEISIAGVNVAHVPALILPAPPAALAASEDGLLPVCVFRAIFVDRLTSTVIFNPD